MSLRRKTITVSTLATAATMALGSWAVFLRQTPQEAYMAECAVYYQDWNSEFGLTGDRMWTTERIDDACHFAYANYSAGGCPSGHRFDPCEGVYGS